MVKSDARRLKQTLLNLVSNAMKFTMQGSIVINVGYSFDKSHLEFIVKDTGVGISEND